MLLHGNLMCSRQFEELIPLLEKDCTVYAVSFDGFDGTGRTTYTTAEDQAQKLADYIEKNCGGRLCCGSTLFRVSIIILPKAFSYPPREWL